MKMLDEVIENADGTLSLRLNDGFRVFMNHFLSTHPCKLERDVLALMMIDPDWSFAHIASHFRVSEDNVHRAMDSLIKKGILKTKTQADGVLVVSINYQLV